MHTSSQPLLIFLIVLFISITHYIWSYLYFILHSLIIIYYLSLLLTTSDRIYTLYSTLLLSYIIALSQLEYEP